MVTRKDLNITFVLTLSVFYQLHRLQQIGHASDKVIPLIEKKLEAISADFDLIYRQLSLSLSLSIYIYIYIYIYIHHLLDA
jgi:hypothetical protein